MTAAVAGADGDLYCVGHRKHGRTAAIWRMRADLSTVWVTHREGYNSEKTFLSIGNEGRVYLAEVGRHELELLSASDGSSLGKRGGKQPEDVDVHWLDLKSCEGLHACPDGTLLVRLEDCLLRFDREGQGIATWPQRKKHLWSAQRNLEPVYGAGGLADRIDHRRLPELGSYPLFMKYYCPSAMGLDGTLYVESSSRIHAFDARGKQVFRKELPDARVERGGMYADGLGRLYVLAELRTKEPCEMLLWRLSRDGRRVKTVATDKEIRGGILSGDAIVVANLSGQVFLFGTERGVLVLDQDGALVYDG